ncbi:hypothetical protein C6P45_000914 [Maudiozyma exigua]|uniref:RRM domain-containing protein n=1 Tax=Maudiozyma exigua TaxID=34358 RepID=A0A9P7B7I5_MAUEX|nr:hypothetical protein C6P45_000914 [Kazachstania exigua]
MGTKVITKNPKETQKEPKSSHNDLLQEPKPKQKNTNRSETKAILEPVQDIYMSNIPPVWTKEDMVKYLSFDKRASLINVSLLTYTVYGTEQSCKIATIKFEGKIDIEKFNDTIHQQQELGSEPFHSVECKFVKVVKTESGKKSKAGKTKKSKKSRLPENIKTKTNKEVIFSNPKEEDTVGLKASKLETKEILSEIAQSTNFTANAIANKNNSSGKIASTGHKEKLKKKKTDNTIFVRNIPYNVSRKELAEFLKVKENNISLPMSRLQDLTTGKIFNSKTTNKGYLFIRYENCDPNEPIERKVEQLQGQILGNRKLMTEIARVKKDFSDYTKPTTIISVTRT